MTFNKLKIKLSIITGLILIILSYYQAIILKYNHFYEFLLVGLFIILYQLTPKKLINKKFYLILYIIFIFGGLITDLLLGLTISKLWYYTYSNIIEYIFLYILIYPIGGIIMIQSYLILKNKFKKNIKKKKFNIKVLKIIGYILLIINFFLTSINLFYPFDNFGKIFFITITGFVFFYLNYKSEKYSNLSYIGDLINNPKLFLTITILVSYSNAFIHEFPNTYAKQWVYNNWLFKNYYFLNMPSDVFFIGWIALTMIPISIYYYLYSINKTKKIT